MNIEKQTFNTLDVLYDDKKWGKRIDPDEWNANFKVLEEGHNELAQKLNQQVADIDVAVQAATSGGGQNINVQYGEGTETLQGALDNVVSDINNRYTKNEVDATVGSNTNSLLANAEYNESTGVFTFTRKDGSKIVFDTVIEKVPASMALKDEPDGSVSLVITNQDGSTTKTNVTSLIEDTVIISSDTINATSVTDAVKKVTTYTLVIKPNSIGLSHVDTELTAKFEETQTAKTLAVQAKDNAVAAQNAAVAAQKSAEIFADNSETSAGESSASASEAKTSELNAKSYAEQAASHRDSASLSANTATKKATDASNSATNAKTSETNAKTSETNASNSAKDAKTYAEQAKTHATNAGNSANQASTYATNASDSADSASLKANEASDSAASALTYKNAAELANTQAQAAKAAAEKARDEAKEIAGGDYVTNAQFEQHTQDGNLHTSETEKQRWNNKVDKEDGKGLSTNDYTTADKNKLSGIAEGANKTVVDSALSTSSTNPVQNKIVKAELDKKVTAVSGKGLSTNDYTNTEKTKLGAINAAIIVQSSEAVATNAWASDTTYTDYPYRASIAIDGCTINHIPEVVFSLVDAMSGTFAPIAETYDGGVYIYASEQPADMIIPTIKLVKVVE